MSDDCEFDAGMDLFGEDFIAVRESGLSGPGCLIEADDPRASGVFTDVVNWNLVGGGPSAPDFVEARSSSRRLVNGGGSWSGTGTAVVYQPEGFTNLAITSIETLTGDGGYAGLILILTEAGAPGETERVRTGFIVPANFMPPVPEPPAE